MLIPSPASGISLWQSLKCVCHLRPLDSPSRFRIEATCAARRPNLKPSRHGLERDITTVWLLGDCRERPPSGVFESEAVLQHQGPEGPCWPRV
eukprot:3412784-Rhodomonas_salina.8